MLLKLLESLPFLFSQEYPQVLTHGDFSMTNILVDGAALKITGIADWSLASIMPFGMDLDALLWTSGFMTTDCWHDYACKPQLKSIFWKEFWAASGVKGAERRARTQCLAEAACAIGHPETDLPA